MDVAVELACILSDELVAFTELDGGIRAPDHSFNRLHGGRVLGSERDTVIGVGVGEGGEVAGMW